VLIYISLIRIARTRLLAKEDRARSFATKALARWEPVAKDLRSRNMLNLFEFRSGSCSKRPSFSWNSMRRCFVHFVHCAFERSLRVLHSHRLVRGSYVRRGFQFYPRELCLPQGQLRRNFQIIRSTLASPLDIESRLIARSIIRCLLQSTSLNHRQPTLPLPLPHPVLLSLSIRPLSRY